MGSYSPLASMTRSNCKGLVLIALAIVFVQAEAWTGRNLQQTDGTVPAPTGTATEARFIICLPIVPDYEACKEAATMLNNPAADVTFTCIAGGSVPGCLKMVADSIATVAKVPASGVYLADSMGMKPVVSEFFSDEVGPNTEGYAVAVVSSEWCYAPDHDSFAALENSTACFSGYSNDGGWNVAMGTLYNDGGMQPAVNNTQYTEDTASAQKYFKDICAPGYYASGPRRDGKKYGKMCDLCPGSTCSVDDESFGAAAYNCAAKGDVLFMELPVVYSQSGAGYLSETSTVTPVATPPAAVEVAPPVVFAPPVPTMPPAAVPPVGSQEEPYEDPNATNAPAPKEDEGGNDNKEKSPKPDKPPKASPAPKSPKPDKPPTTPEEDPSAEETPLPDYGTADEGADAGAADAGIAPAAGGTRRRQRRRRMRTLLQAVADYEPVDTAAEPTTGGDGPTTPAAQVTADEVEIALASKLLFCPSMDPPCQARTAYKECNMARVPSQAFVALDDFASSDDGQLVMQALLQGGENAAFMNAAANVGLPPYMFITPGTTKLTAVDISTNEYLGSEFIDAMDTIGGVLRGELASVSSSGDSGGGLSTAAIIAISVVSILVVGGIVAGGMVYYHKKKKDTGWKKYQDAVKDIQRI